MSYIVGTDIGGTFTDCVIMDNEGMLHIGKSLSTPDDFSRGCLNSVQVTTESIGMSLKDVITKTSVFALGTTIAENAIVERAGAKTGLLTTKGFEDTILIMRGSGRFTGLSEFEITHVTATRKPPPLVSQALIRGIIERTDSQGKVVVPLNLEDAKRAISELNSEGVESLAVCLLWSFRNNSHEQEVKKLIGTIMPGKFVTTSSEFIPILGEYERMATTVLNAYVGPVVSRSVSALAATLSGMGFRGHFFVMYSHGGLLPASATATNAVGLIEGGPVAGLVGTTHLGTMMDEPNIVAADMGGTTFKVGVIRNGQPARAREPSIAQYPIASPRLDVVSIGAGGGSIAWVEEVTGLLKVGPRSAGASPGPISYDLGGTEPTLTDADVICGYLNPSYFLGGRMTLNKELATTGMTTHIASRLGMSAIEAADGVRKIAEAQAADLIRKVTIERGYDLRDFTLFAYGGAGPVHADDIGSELNVKRIIVPATASVHCSLGMITSNAVHEYVLSDPMRTPADPERVRKDLKSLQQKAIEDLKSDGFSSENIELKYSADVRYRRQVNEVNTPFEFEGEVSRDQLQKMTDSFEVLYEELFGKGSGYRPAGVDLVNFRLTAVGRMKKPVMARDREVGSEDASKALKGTREVFHGGLAETARIYDFNLMRVNNAVEGPAVIETPVTAVAIRKGHKGTVDPYRNVHITW